MTSDQRDIPARIFLNSIESPLVLVGNGNGRLEITGQPHIRGEMQAFITNTIAPHVLYRRAMAHLQLHTTAQNKLELDFRAITKRGRNEQKKL